MSERSTAQYRYYDLIMVAFVTILLTANLIGPGKSCKVAFFGGSLVFGAGNIFFPLSYLFDDILTEVYGYARSRRVIWVGFFAMLFATVMATVVIALPVDPKEPYDKVLQPALETVYGKTWRIVLASLVAFWIGDFVNSYVLAKMKIWTSGRWLWTRTIGSTIAGEGVDSLLFYPISFAGIWTVHTLVSVVAFNWIFKVTVETVMTPFTYYLVSLLKRSEGVDYYDTDTDFNPFSLRA
jgi:queuosine precursor transporter